MKILLVEDESHKRDELISYLNECFPHTDTINSAKSVREAVLAIEITDFDLIILDMALPTFTIGEEAEDGGHDQVVGGVEVLRTLKAIGKQTNIIIVTQYPDILIDGRRFKLRLARPALSQKYKQNIIGVVSYKYKSASNRSKMMKLLEGTW